MTATGPHGYRAKRGYYTDQETGLVALAYRYYEPGVGRFFSRDPTDWPLTVNLHTCVSNNPVWHIDPGGLQGMQACSSGDFCRAACYIACAELGPNELIVAACMAICEALKKLTCDELWWTCWRIGSKRGKEICLMLYDILCLGV
ncbi:MAG: RHS repeat-associated core domain-containing protein [Armatimonadetes bacterium]|nr:RHS repeat-associated core domain-containing protein [Armatimonadota bacterium]